MPATLTAPPPPRRFTRWIAKQRPAGDCVVDQADNKTGRLTRFGPFPAERTARDLATDLNGD